MTSTIGDRVAGQSNSHAVRHMAASACGLLLCALSVVFLSTGAAAAQSPQTSPQQAVVNSGEAVLDAVTVEARRQRELLERQISTYVSEITNHNRNDSLLRWQIPICPLVAGLPIDKGTFVFDRVSQIASDAGVPLAEPECAPNLLIVMTREPEAFLRSWWRLDPQLFNNERGVGGIKRTISKAAPLRVFYNACSVPPALAKTFRSSVIGNCNTGGPPGSKLKRGAVRVIYSVILVVDLKQIEGREIGSLSDYIAMVALAQIRRSAELGAAPTILRLFDDTEAVRPHSLTTWDQTFLRSLYASQSDDVMQVSEIKRRMQQDLVR